MCCVCVCVVVSLDASSETAVNRNIEVHKQLGPCDVEMHWLFKTKKIKTGRGDALAIHYS